MEDETHKSQAERTPSPNRLIAGLVRERTSLELQTVDLCFIAGLYLHAEGTGLASFEEETLVDTFEQVCEVAEPEADWPRKRATHAIQRMRDQQMLARVDGAGIARGGEFALTGLAAAVVHFYLADARELGSADHRLADPVGPNAERC